jgi:hypothetical protein
MRAFRQYVEWADYVDTQLVQAEVDEDNMQSVLATAEAELMLQSMPDAEALRKREDTMTRVKAEVRVAPSLKTRREELMVLYARRKMLSTIAARMERGSSLISRELTRRTSGLIPAQSRRSRWTP